jgi:rSAM/selenodomain-associated transferase 2
VRLSVIVPALDEEAVIGATLERLAPLRAAGHQVVLADGGSGDRTREIAAPLADRVLTGPRGRARQMNAGAAAAHGHILLFLHADTLLPESAAGDITEGLQSTGRRWGRFDVRLTGSLPLLRLVERMMNARSRLTGVATGDQALFVERALFEAVGGFPDIALMEDVALCKRLKREGAPLCLRSRVVTSSRRWEERGVLRTIGLMWGLRAAYAAGVSPERLARLYR